MSLRPKITHAMYLKVYEALDEEQARSVPELMKATGLSAGDVNNATYNLRKVGHVRSQKSRRDGSSVLLHYRQTRGPAQGQNGLTTYHRGLNKPAAKSALPKTETPSPLIQRIRAAIERAVDAAAELEQLMLEAEADLSLMAQIRATKV